MSDPTKFFQDYARAEKTRKFSAEQVYSRKMLRRYFLEFLDIDVASIWEDDNIKDKMAEVRARTAHPLLVMLHFLPACRVCVEEVYKDFPKTKPWQEMIRLLQESPRALLVFPIARSGMHAFHNMPWDKAPVTVARKPRIIWPGNAGNALTLVNLDVFLTEYHNW